MELADGYHVYVEARARTGVVRADKLNNEHHAE